MSQNDSVHTWVQWLVIEQILYCSAEVVLRAGGLFFIKYDKTFEACSATMLDYMLECCF